MSWYYMGVKLEDDDIPEKAIGFIYIITDKTNKYIYIGKKVLNFKRKKKLTKKDKLLPENKRKKFKVEVSVSDWKDYFGSSQSLTSEVNLKGKEKFKREILEFCFSKTELTYKEVWFQFKYNVLEVNSYNQSILGRFYKKKVA